MPITIDSLIERANTLHQQRAASANMAQQCEGALQVITQQINELRADAEAKLKQQAEEACDNGGTNEQAAEQAA